MKWTVFTSRPVRGAVNGESILDRWEVEGDEDGLVADEAAEELEEQGYEIIDIVDSRRAPVRERTGWRLW